MVKKHKPEERPLYDSGDSVDYFGVMADIFMWTMPDELRDRAKYLAEISDELTPRKKRSKEAQVTD